MDRLTSNQQNYIVFWKKTSFCGGQVNWCKVFPFTQDPDALKKQTEEIIHTSHP